MHKQRIVLIIASIVGMTSVFLTWFQGFVLLPDSLLENSGGLEDYPQADSLLGIDLGVVVWFIFGLFLIMFLLALFLGKKKEPLNAISAIVLSIGSAFVVVAMRVEKMNPDYYNYLNDQFAAISSVAANAQTQEWADLNLMPPTSGIGLFLALGASFLALIGIILFRKKHT